MVTRLLVKKRRKLVPGLTRELPPNGIVTVGNDASASIALVDGRIAPEQFVIVCEEAAQTLMCRAEGTRVNGRRLAQGAIHELRAGDEISVAGGYAIVVSDGSDEPVSGAVPEAPAPEKGLGEVLEDLPGEEKFYFIVTDADGDETVEYLDSDETFVGWNEDGECVFAPDEAAVATVGARLVKGWDGVTIEPARTGAVRVNGHLSDLPRRLRNGDVAMLAGPDASAAATSVAAVSLEFHEPPAMLLLDSLLPGELPPPVSLDEASTPGAFEDAGGREIDEGDALHLSRIPKAAPVKRGVVKRNILGYFTITEVIVMMIGTLITAAIIFLVLEYF